MRIKRRVLQCCSPQRTQTHPLPSRPVGRGLISSTVLPSPASACGVVRQKIKSVKASLVRPWLCWWEAHCLQVCFLNYLVLPTGLSNGVWAFSLLLGSGPSLCPTPMPCGRETNALTLNEPIRSVLCK
jgi:hypothetical protein